MSTNLAGMLSMLSVMTPIMLRSSGQRSRSLCKYFGFHLNLQINLYIFQISYTYKKLSILLIKWLTATRRRHP